MLEGVECCLLFSEGIQAPDVQGGDADLAHPTTGDDEPGMMPECDCVLVVFSVTDTGSMRQAEEILNNLWKSGELNSRAVIMVGNKTDLVRTRQVPIDGESLQSHLCCLICFELPILLLLVLECKLC